MDAARVLAAVTACGLAGALRYGGDLFHLRTPAFQLLTVGFAGGATVVAYRRGGFRFAFPVAYGVLLLEYLLLGSFGYRVGWAAFLWSLATGLGLVAAAAAFRATGSLVRFGRFVFVSILVGLGFVTASLLLALVFRLQPVWLAARVNFAIGSLAGAAFGLALEVFDIVRPVRARDPSTPRA